MLFRSKEDKKGDLFVTINVKPLEMKKTLSGGEKQKICQLLGSEYVPIGSTKSCEITPIEEKYNIEKNDNADNSDDENDNIPPFMRGMPGKTQRVVIEGGQQCPVQ